MDQVSKKLSKLGHCNKFQITLSDGASGPTHGINHIKNELMI